jgi:transcriptional regulator NrdR family protein
MIMAKHGKNGKKKLKKRNPQSFRIVVKRRKSGLCEEYDERKVYGSVYAACAVVKCKEQRCEKIANSVAKKVTKFVKNNKRIRSDQILRLATVEIRKFNKHAAFMYETHMDIG